MATTHATHKTPAEADKTNAPHDDAEAKAQARQGTAVQKAKAGHLEVTKNDDGEAVTPAQQDKLNPPRNDDEAQAQAAAVDPSTAAGPGWIEPIAYEASPAIGQKITDPKKEPDFKKVAQDAVNGALETNVRKALNDANTSIRLAIASGMGWDTNGVHRVGLRVAPQSEKGKLVVEVRKDYEDWQSVRLDG